MKQPQKAATQTADKADAPATAAHNKALEISIVASLLALFLLLSFTSMRRKNATFDEGTHIPAAYTYVAYGDFRLNPEHPPLTKWLAGFAQRLLTPTVVTTDAAWENGEQWEFGAKYLYAWNQADRLIFAARTPGVLLAALLGLVVFFAARWFYGWQAGCFALGLWVLNPDVLAHAQLVTTDLPVAGFLFLAVYRYFRALQQTTAANVLLVGLAVGGCLVTKFSGVLIFPMLLLVGSVFVFSRQPGQWLLHRKAPARELVKRREKAALALGLIVAAGVMSLAVVWASYGFHARLSPQEAVANRINWPHYWVKEKFTTEALRLPYTLHLLPEAYVYGFLVMLESAENRLSYLFGETSYTGWWYYFLITFFVKTPILLLALIGLGLVFLRKYGAGLMVESLGFCPVGVYWLITLTANLNIGHRHLLPIYPFLIVFAAKIARAFSLAEAEQTDAWRRRGYWCGMPSVPY
ncbi:MAG: glycosyltransferase family 39 protein [Blastocatellia bacterium]